MSREVLRSHPGEFPHAGYVIYLGDLSWRVSTAFETADAPCKHTSEAAADAFISAIDTCPVSDRRAFSDQLHQDKPAGSGPGCCALRARWKASHRVHHAFPVRLTGLSLKAVAEQAMGSSVKDCRPEKFWNTNFQGDIGLQPWRDVGLVPCPSTVNS